MQNLRYTEDLFMEVLVPTTVQGDDGERTYPELSQNDMTTRIIPELIPLITGKTETYIEKSLDCCLEFEYGDSCRMKDTQPLIGNQPVGVNHDIM